MDRRVAVRSAFAAVLAGVLAACGQKGDLYLPDAPPEVITRSAPTSPASEGTEAPNSPRTVDSPLGAPTPAPEVTAPAGTLDTQDPQESEDPEKDKDAAPPPPPRN